MTPSPEENPPAADASKRRAAEAALALVRDVRFLGVGTGSTIRYFIEGLAGIQTHFEAAVASSEQTAALLRQAGIRVLDLNETGDVDLYVDGADAFDPHFRLIKGHGGALLREKILATASRKFVVVVDSRKRFDRLADSVAVPVEVLPFARSFTARQIVRLGGAPALREHYLTDNGNQILDILHLPLNDPPRMEIQLKSIPGVIESGIFAHRVPDIIFVAGGSSTVESLERPDF